MGAQDKHRARRQRRQAHRALEQVDARKQLLLHALVLSRHVGGHVKDLLLLARKVVVVLQHPLAKLLLSRHRVRHLLLAPHQLLLERFDPQRRALQQPRIVELGRALASLCQTGSTCKTARWARGGPTTLQATPGLRGCPHGAPAFFSLPLPLPFFGAMPASAAGGWGRRGSSTAWPVRKIGRSAERFPTQDHSVDTLRTCYLGVRSCHSRDTWVQKGKEIGSLFLLRPRSLCAQHISRGWPR